MHLQTWYITLLIYFIGSTCFSLLQRRLAKSSRLPLNLIAALFFALVVYPAGVAYALISGSNYIHWGIQPVLLLLGVGILIGTFNSLALKFNKHIDATQYTIISNLYTPLTVVLGVFILREAFSGQQFVGMALLILGAVIVAVDGFTSQTFRISRYSFICGLASLMLGVGIFLERACLDYMSIGAYLVLGWGLQGVVAIFLARNELRVIPTITKTEWLQIFQIGAVRSMHALGFMLSVGFSRNVALISTVTSFRVPLVFIASYVILSERKHAARKAFGVVVATVGLLLT